MQIVRLVIFLLVFLCSLNNKLGAQELNARVVVNHQKIEGTNVSVFENLQTSLTEYINDKKWTNQQYANNERISCTFNITVNKYDDSDGSFTCSLLIQSLRPVYGSTYTTVTFSNKDDNFDFTYREFDKLEFRADQLDNDLMALVGYYAYLIIGIDMDTMSPSGGEEPLQTALSIVNNAQSLSSKGWKAFDSDKNRYAIISDYMDGSMKPFREMQYKYYREGLDVMSTNSERGRGSISEALLMLKKAHENKTMSKLPQLFIEYKRDELVNIYTNKGLAKDKTELYELLSNINASYNSYWRKMTK